MSASNALRSAATGEHQNPVMAFRGFLEKQKSQLAAARSGVSGHCKKVPVRATILPGASQ